MNHERFFENFMLGVTQGEISIEERALNIAAIHKLASLAVLNINVMSRSLDHMVFDRSDIIEAFSKMVRRNRNTSVKILIYDSTKIIKHGHRLINLADRLPSKFSVRKIPKDFTIYNEGLVTADGKGFLFNPQSDRYEGSVSFNDQTKCAELDKTFTDLWHQSEIEPELRRVSV